VGVEFPAEAVAQAASGQGAGAHPRPTVCRTAGPGAPGNLGVRRAPARPVPSPPMDDELRFEVVVEIPKGSRNKYEADHDTGELWLDRHLFTATTYPADYGFFPRTLSGDGDPLDALVMMAEPTFPGCHLWARPVGVFTMRDEAGDDAKILCVPAGDPRWAAVRDLADVEPHLMNEIRHFFEVYKDLEPGKSAEIGAWAGVEAAVAEIQSSQANYPG